MKIIKRSGSEVIFDVEKIDRVGMDAEADGVMTAVYLPDVVDDFNAEGKDGRAHRYACSGIDGTSFAPRMGASGVSPYMLYVAYGVYGETDRDDNDNQVKNESIDDMMKKSGMFTNDYESRGKKNGGKRGNNSRGRK